MPGVFCLPHDWGHDREGVVLRVAQTNPGINMNELADDQCVDSISANAVVHGVAVEVFAVTTDKDIHLAGAEHLERSRSRVMFDMAS